MIFVFLHETVIPCKKFLVLLFSIELWVLHLPWKVLRLPLKSPHGKWRLFACREVWEMPAFPWVSAFLHLPFTSDFFLHFGLKGCTCLHEDRSGLVKIGYSFTRTDFFLHFRLKGFTFLHEGRSGLVKTESSFTSSFTSIFFLHFILHFNFLPSLHPSLQILPSLQTSQDARTPPP